MKVSRNFLIVSALVLLLIVGVVQALQLNRIKTNVDIIDVSASTLAGKTSSSTTTSSSSSSGSVPTNIQNLPGMVGGC